MLTCCGSQHSHGMAFRLERLTLRPLGNSTYRRTNDPQLSSTYFEPSGKCAGRRTELFIFSVLRYYRCFCATPHIVFFKMQWHYPGLSPLFTDRAFILGGFFVLVGARSKHFSDLRGCLAANVIATALKFGDCLAP